MDLEGSVCQEIMRFPCFEGLILLSEVDAGTRPATSYSGDFHFKPLTNQKLPGQHA